MPHPELGNRDKWPRTTSICETHKRQSLEVKMAAGVIGNVDTGTADSERVGVEKEWHWG